MKYSSKSDIELAILVVLSNKKTDRGLRLSEFTSRCVMKGEVHEFLVANEWNSDRNMVFNDISYLGFFEFITAGVLGVGDRLLDENNELIGEIIGFDFTHMPNHMNVALHSVSKKTGTERGMLASRKIKIKGY